MYDLTDESGEGATYECLECGEIVTADANPVECPECSHDSLQNRALSLE